MKNWTLIFDLDGCLIDSSEVQKAAFFGSYQAVVGDNNCPSFEEYMKHTGSSVEGMLKGLGLPVEMASHFRHISTKAIDKIIINDDAINLVRKLRQKGCKTAICTGKDHYRTVDILKYYHIDDLFDVLVCGDDVAEPKPSAMPIVTAMHELGATKENTVMIGDGKNDVVSAQNAGVKSILTLWYGNESVLLAPDYTAKTVCELENILLKLIEET